MREHSPAGEPHSCDSTVGCAWPPDALLSAHQRLCCGSNVKCLGTRQTGAKPSYYGPIQLVLVLVLLTLPRPTEAPTEALARARLIRMLSSIGKMHLIHLVTVYRLFASTGRVILRPPPRRTAPPGALSCCGGRIGARPRNCRRCVSAFSTSSNSVIHFGLACGLPG